MSKASIIGAILGFVVTRSFFGAFIGYLIGSALGSSFISASTTSSGTRNNSFSSGGSQNDFARALLILSASVMKADGSVKKSELEYVKQFFNRQFPPSYAKQYILRFRDILKKEYNVYNECAQLIRFLSVDQRLFLIQYLFGIAQADGHVSEAEVKLIEQIASYFRISTLEFQQLKSMFYKDASNAYKVLGLNSNATDEEVKKAYRKMAIKHHPDKYAQMGEEHQKAAKEKFQKLQDAYETIKKERGIK
ncbi:MAG: molecular chaperone DjlA [Crocinitomicaceae bacterium]|nr:molecular chaperone DjlA [Crocinitomicaceae bacterium]|tara:strand:- start:828 stop:1574 length:747 start_codon:yes stop_codon:yes gene_type:complete